MATKRAVSKTQTIRDYLNAHPAAVPSEIAAALDEQGITITPRYIGNIKAKIARADPATKTAVKPDDPLTRDQIKEIAQAITAIRSRKLLARYFTPIQTKISETAPPENPANTLTQDQIKEIAQAIKTIRSRKVEVNKAQAVRDYLKAHRRAKNPEVVAALAKQGIAITADYVCNIKFRDNKR